MNKEKIEPCWKRIEKALAIRNMKQSELCKLANVPKSSLCLYLKGAYSPKQERISQMANVLNVSEAWLMGYDVPMEGVNSLPTHTLQLTSSEEIMLELFKQIPENQQKILIQMIRDGLRTKE